MRPWQFNDVDDEDYVPPGQKASREPAGKRSEILAAFQTQAERSGQKTNITADLKGTMQHL